MLGLKHPVIVDPILNDPHSVVYVRGSTVGMSRLRTLSNQQITIYAVMTERTGTVRLWLGDVSGARFSLEEYVGAVSASISAPSHGSERKRYAIHYPCLITVGLDFSQPYSSSEKGGVTKTFRVNGVPQTMMSGAFSPGTNMFKLNNVGFSSCTDDLFLVNVLHTTGQMTAVENVLRARWSV